MVSVQQERELVRFFKWWAESPVAVLVFGLVLWIVVVVACETPTASKYPQAEEEDSVQVDKDSGRKGN